MAFIRPIDLPNKRIRYRSGYDGNEPRQGLCSSVDLSETEVRFAIIISSDYPETLCDGYVNKDILAMIQRAIAENGLHVICKDIYCLGDVLPEEQPGSLSEEEEYVLVNDAEVHVGYLQIWCYYCSSGGSFYGEFDPIIDMIMPKELLEGLKNSIRRLAEVNSVEIEDFGYAAETPSLVKRKSFFGRLLDWR